MRLRTVVTVITPCTVCIVLQVIMCNQKLTSVSNAMTRSIARAVTPLTLRSANTARLSISLRVVSASLVPVTVLTAHRPLSATHLSVQAAPLSQSTALMLTPSAAIAGVNSATLKTLISARCASQGSIFQSSMTPQPQIQTLHRLNRPTTIWSGQFVNLVDPPATARLAQLRLLTSVWLVSVGLLWSMEYVSVVTLPV